MLVTPNLRNVIADRVQTLPSGAVAVVRAVTDSQRRGKRMTSSP
jgi:hypothetical protein